MQVRKSVWSPVVVCLVAALVEPSIFAQQQRAEAAVKAATPHPELAASQLPVTRVALYKNGVGFFEHSGRVSGDGRVTIDFTTAQLNDVLQSLTAIDLDGGRIAGADYNSTTPVEQQLRALPLGLGTEPNEVAFYNAIRGARVEVRAAGSTLTGRLMNVESVTSQTKDGQQAERRLLTVVGDGGEVKTVELTPTTEVRLLDGDLRGDVRRYLELLASTRNDGLRHLTLEDNGTGSRELRVSYISEVPVWKSTYRILFAEGKSGAAGTATLQGWSVVDNTTGADWNHVQLSLIAGAPQSFIQPLSVPYYSRRPEIPLPQEAQLSPQTHESGQVTGGGTISGTVQDPTGAAIAGATITATNEATGFQTNAQASGSGTFSLSSLPPGTYRVETSSPGFQRLVYTGIAVSDSAGANLSLKLQVGAAAETVAVTSTVDMADVAATKLPMRAANRGVLGGVMGGSGAPLSQQAMLERAEQSFGNQATGTGFDDYFEYRIGEPVTIRKNESAMVPILQEKVNAERVTLWSASHPVPLRALWITNTSKMTLDRGSFSIVEDGNFGGEGLLDPVHSGERRLLSYAVDQAVRVSTDYSHNTTRVTQVTASKGVLEMKQSVVMEIEYLVRNASSDPRMVIMEHPVRPGFTLDSDPKPEETTPAVYRFRVATKPGETVRLHVGERRLSSLRYTLTNSNDNQLTYILNQTNGNEKLKQALAPILDARRKVADVQTAVDEVNGRLTSLHSDEERERANVTALANTDKTSRERFVRELNETEDKITAAQKDQETAQANLKAAKDDLAAKIEGLQIDEQI